MSEIAAPLPTGSEQVIAVIGGLTRLSGFMGTRQKRYTLVVTDRRIVFAELTKDRVSELTHQACDDAKTAGEGLLGRAGAQMHSIDGVAATYWKLSSDAALGETPGNFAIERSAIVKVKFKSKTRVEGPDTDSGGDQDELRDLQAAGRRVTAAGPGEVRPSWDQLTNDPGPGPGWRTSPASSRGPARGSGIGPRPTGQRGRSRTESVSMCSSTRRRSSGSPTCGSPFPESAT